MIYKHLLGSYAGDQIRPINISNQPAITLIKGKALRYYLTDLAGLLLPFPIKISISRLLTQGIGVSVQTLT